MMTPGNAPQVSVQEATEVIVEKQEMRPKLTPGPWKKFGRSDARGGSFTIVGEAPRVGPIATVRKSRLRSSYFDARTPEEGEANARLIAATPEMYEALQLIADHPRVQHPCGCEDHLSDECCAVAAPDFYCPECIAGRVIAKVEGR
jgi:hypothetical protein